MHLFILSDCNLAQIKDNRLKCVILWASDWYSYTLTTGLAFSMVNEGKHANVWTHMQQSCQFDGDNNLSLCGLITLFLLLL